MKQAAEQAKKRNAWESAGGDDQDKAMELMAGKVRTGGGSREGGRGLHAWCMYGCVCMCVCVL